MMTTILVSTGKSRLRDFAVRPTKKKSHQQLSTKRGFGWLDENKRTAVLVSTENPSAEDVPFRIDNLADSLGVRSGAHRVDVHLVNFGEGAEEVGETGSEQSEMEELLVYEG
jgi:hypothetical protein